MDDYNPRTRYEHYYVRMARLEGRGELQKRYPDDFYVRPFQIAGNVYYIGNKAVCSHLIDTGEGLIVDLLPRTGSSADKLHLGGRL